jgi:hypothetical protein
METTPTSNRPRYRHTVWVGGWLPVTVWDEVPPSSYGIAMNQRADAMRADAMRASS